MEITNPVISQFSLEYICNDYKEANCPYIDLTEGEGRYYVIKNFLFFKKEEYLELLRCLNLLNNVIMKKTVFHLMEQHKKDLDKFYKIMETLGFTKSMTDIMIYEYKKYDVKTFDNFPLTFYGRFDAIVDQNGDFKIVEQNSETPAGLPEGLHSPILKNRAFNGALNNYIDVNEGFDYRMYQSFKAPIQKIRDESKKKEIILAVAFSNDNLSMNDILYRNINEILRELKKEGKALKVLDTNITENKNYADSKNEFYFREFPTNIGQHKIERLIQLNKIMSQVNRFLDIVDLEEGNISELTFTDGEDFNNGLHLAEFFQRQLEGHNVNVQIVDVMDIEVRKGKGLYYNIDEKDTKIDYVYSFYPLEWFFLDDGADSFWDLYKKGEFSILNNTLTLITQSKAFWAYLFENINKIGLTDGEKVIVEKYVPKYYFNKKENTISKPLFFREGAGINDNSFVGQMVYQEKVEQKVFTVNKFIVPPEDIHSDDTMNGYLTIGIYYGEDYGSGNSYIGNYSRFCEKEITDYSSYFLPVIIGDKNTNTPPTLNLRSVRKNSL